MNLNGKSATPLPGDPLEYLSGKALPALPFAAKLKEKHAVVKASEPVDVMVKKFIESVGKDGFLKEMPEESKK